MKRLFNLIVLLVVAISIYAQGIYIYKTDGTRLRFMNAEVDSIVAFEKQSSNLNGHEAVDLGLSVKWATCNVGANSPEEYGVYFAWGETKEKESYSESTYKYLISSKYQDIGDDIAGTNYDVASVMWGGSWHIPTHSQLSELYNKCTWLWTTLNGVNGQLVTGPNGASIFLPAAGHYFGNANEYKGKKGSYWSSTAADGRIYMAMSSGFSESSEELVFSQNTYTSRYFGLTIRAVAE